MPDGLCHRFDEGQPGTVVTKSTRRQVVTLELEQFQAIEVQRATADEPPSRIDSPLGDLVPKGNTYGYDVIAHVGCETFLRGRTLQEVARDLPRHIPFSSLFDLQHKFLFYFGHVHRAAASAMADYFHRRMVRAVDALGTLLSDPQVRQGATRVLLNFEKLLRDYLADPKVIAAARQYEVAFEELVLGHLDNLPRKMALAAATAGPWTKWRRLHQPLNIGRLPRRLLRQENLVENLITFYGSHHRKQTIDAA